MDCYYHGYSGPGGRCIGCEIDEANSKGTVDFPARDAEGRVIRDRYKPKATTADVSSEHSSECACKNLY